MMALLVAGLVGGAVLVYRTQAAEPAEEAPAAVAAQTEKEEVSSDGNADRESSEQNSRNLLSSSPMPRPALVSFDKGQILVRTLDVVYEPTAVVFEGQMHTSYEKAEVLKTKHYDTALVKVYDVRGKKIDKKELPRLLKHEMVALASFDPHAADPLNLRLFKEGTLLFVLPSPGPAIPPAAAAPAPGVVYVPAPTPAAYGGPAPSVPAIVAPPPIAPAALPNTAVKEDPDICEVHVRAVRIPFLVERRKAVKSLQLFASADMGKTCRRSVSPDENSFVFHAPKDGLYWLNIQVVGRDGKTEPSGVPSVRPQLKIRVNTGSNR
jgi:hypothetical protein